MNLFEINARIEAAFESAVDMETGEITDELAYAELDALQMEFGQKTENILLWIKTLTAEAKALKEQKQVFADRQSKAEKKAESLKRYVAQALAGQKFATDRVSVTWRKSETAEYVGDVMLLPAECIRVKEPEVDKTALKKLLKAGTEIEGAVLVEKNNMQIK